MRYKINMSQVLAFGAYLLDVRLTLGDHALQARSDHHLFQHTCPHDDGVVFLLKYTRRHGLGQCLDVPETTTSSAHVAAKGREGSSKHLLQTDGRTVPQKTLAFGFGPNLLL